MQDVSLGERNVLTVDISQCGDSKSPIVWSLAPHHFITEIRGVLSILSDHQKI